MNPVRNKNLQNSADLPVASRTSYGMKAVILAAGEGKRMGPLTLGTPKPLLKVNSKPIIDYVLESFPPEIDEVIVVVKFLGEQIKKHIGKKYRGMRIRYVPGSDKGNAYSFMAASKYLEDARFLLVYGDEIPDPIDVKNCLTKDLSILVFKPRDPKVCGIAYLRKDGTIRKIIEKPKKTKSDLAIGGMMVLNTNIFNYTPLPTRGEFYFSSMVGLFARDHKVFPIKARDFVGDLTVPQDLIRVGNILSARHK